MAIGKMNRTGDPEGNPRAAEIASNFAMIRDALARYDGAEAARILERLAEVDRPIWNACLWKAEDWLVSWFDGRGLGRNENFVRENFAREALTSFLYRIFPADLDPSRFTAEKLPRICQELRRLDQEVRNARRVDVGAAPPEPAAVHRAIADVVPGALFDDNDGSQS